jgi:Fe(3+) dicitrate transport protein
MQNNTIRNAILAALIGLLTPTAIYAELNTQVPKELEDSFSIPLNLDMPAQPLAAALRQFSIQSNLSLTVDSALIVDKKSPAVKGRMTRKEAIQRMLDGSGLQGNIENDKIFIKRATKEDRSVQLDKVEVRAKRFYEIGPLPGLGLTKDQIPGNVQSITAEEIKQSHSLSLTDLMNRKLQSVTVNDYQGNPFQMDVQYRGFTAGPQIGTPQGLSVFFDGIRVNEPFGDVVNWDMIPMNALAGVDVFPGSNPIFGLNTLGGAFTLKTKDGFNHEGIDADVLTGSFGRKQLQTTGGWNNGVIGLFGAGNFFLEDGWRENSPSRVNQFFGKASYRGDKLDLNLSTLIVGTNLVGNGLIPSEMYAQDRNASFTSKDETKNRLQQFQLSGNYFVNDNFTITGQVYRRDSKRHQVGADVFTDYDRELQSQRIRTAGQEATCLFAESSATKGIPSYYVVPVVADSFGNADLTTTDFYNDVANNYSSNPAYPDGIIFINPNGIDTASGATFGSFKNNVALPDDMAIRVRQQIAFGKNYQESIRFARDFYNPNDPNNPVPQLKDPAGNIVLDGSGQAVSSYGYGQASTFSSRSGASQLGSNLFQDSLLTGDVYFYTFNNSDPLNPQLIKNYVVFEVATNNDACFKDIAIDNPAYNPVAIDGAGNVSQPAGVVVGTPTAVFNDNQIDQLVNGASVQFNWNLDEHKFMVGASIDAASATYSNKQQLGFLTADREAYLDPAQAHPMFIGAYVPVSNNEFDGTNTTKSIYFSETWTPTSAWNFTVSGRYNQTTTKNKIAARYGINNYGIGDLISYPDSIAVCDGDCTTNRPPTSFRPFLGFNTVNKAETEKFSYYSFNPSLGATWQANENLNVYANLAQGTRTPSVIELGCALDKTPTQSPTGGIQPKSVAEKRECTLPTALSGDPFLPQIKATSYDIGLRGTLKNPFSATDFQWNLGAYQTDLKDDIYFVSVMNGAGFFDTIGKTRRRGIEAGISGRKDKLSFGLNYSLNDATFESSFKMYSLDNSSAVDVGDGFREITVKPGSTLPGVALHNLNATIGYDVTDKWHIGLSTVLHSKSYVRGNENNEHRKGAIRTTSIYNPVTDTSQIVNLPPTQNPGTVPGYATFNFQTSYKFNSEWTGTLLINNVFDREYFSAGRLGRNAFSPSINGAIGVSGYNHNSNDHLSTNFIAPGAPRGIWLSLNYQFKPD